MDGFSGSGIYVNAKRGTDQTRIEPSAYTFPVSNEAINLLGTLSRLQSVISSTIDQQTGRLDSVQKLYALYFTNADKLLAEGQS